MRLKNTNAFLRIRLISKIYLYNKVVVVVVVTMMVMMMMTVPTYWGIQYRDWYVAVFLDFMLISVVWMISISPISDY